jgi:hypothetical protein
MHIHPVPTWGCAAPPQSCSPLSAPRPRPSPAPPLPQGAIAGALEEFFEDGEHGQHLPRHIFAFSRLEEQPRTALQPYNTNWKSSLAQPCSPTTPVATARRCLVLTFLPLFGPFGLHPFFEAADGRQPQSGLTFLLAAGYNMTGLTFRFTNVSQHDSTQSPPTPIPADPNMPQPGTYCSLSRSTTDHMVLLISLDFHTIAHTVCS